MTRFDRRWPTLARFQFGTQSGPSQVAGIVRAAPGDVGDKPAHQAAIVLPSCLSPGVTA
jgi:hypothetical protein